MILFFLENPGYQEWEPTHGNLEFSLVRKKEPPVCNGIDSVTDRRLSICSNRGISPSPVVNGYRHSSILTDWPGLIPPKLK